MTRTRQRGFTIIELLIATAVFAIILIVLTTAILQFSKQYYKGIISSRTQNTARTVLDDVSRAIQFSGGNVTQLTTGGAGWCIGSSDRYSYALNKQLIDSGTPGPNQGRHSLVSDTVTGCNSSTPALAVASLTSVGAPLQDARELLGEKMRLAKFQIVGSNNVYRITVRVVYGDDALLCSPAANDCSQNTTSSALGTAGDLSCKLSAGSQFCAVSELSTTVTKRVD